MCGVSVRGLRGGDGNLGGGLVGGVGPWDAPRGVMFLPQFLLPSVLALLPGSPKAPYHDAATPLPGNHDAKGPWTETSETT